MTIHYQNDRPAMTYIPEMKDEATNEPVKGTDMVVETQHVSFAKEDQPHLLDPEFNEPQKALSEEDQDDGNYWQDENGYWVTDGFISNDELDATELAAVSDEIHNASFSPDQGLADAILQVDLSDSPADTTVAYLAHKVYSGDITPEEAFNDALMSGVNHAELIRSFNNLKEQLQ